MVMRLAPKLDSASTPEISILQNSCDESCLSLQKSQTTCLLAPYLPTCSTGKFYVIFKSISWSKLTWSSWLGNNGLSWESMVALRVWIVSLLLKCTSRGVASVSASITEFCIFLYIVFFVEKKLSSNKTSFSWTFGVWKARIQILGFKSCAWVVSAYLWKILPLLKEAITKSKLSTSI